MRLSLSFFLYAILIRLEQQSRILYEKLACATNQPTGSFEPQIKILKVRTRYRERT